MPLFEYLCQDCGKLSEILVSASSGQPRCQACESGNLKKLLSAHSVLSGASKGCPAEQGDHPCCAEAPGHPGCAGPGSCCGTD